LKTASPCIPALIVLSLIAPDCRPREPGWAGRIENVDGVTVVHNPSRPRTEDRVLVLEEDLSIGQEGGGPEYLFSGIGGLAVDTAGDIYAIDTREAAVRVFDKNGMYLRTIGRKGQGPGETQYPVFVQITAEGELAVYDYSAGRMLFYSSDGAYLRQKTTSRIVFPIGLDSEGRLIAQHILAPPPKGGKVILRFDRDYGSEQDLAREEMGPDRVFDIGRPACYAALSPDDRVVWGDSAEYLLNMLSPEGKLIRKIIGEFHARAITDAERDENRGKYADALKFGMQISFRDRWPAFSGLFFDDEGRLLVRTYERGMGSGNSFFYDVFDREGVYESRVALPMTLERNSIWKDGKIYTVESDESGLPLIKRHRITWKRGGPS
jgi:hypothetical protein